MWIINLAQEWKMGGATKLRRSVCPWNPEVVSYLNVFLVATAKPTFRNPLGFTSRRLREPLLFIVRTGLLDSCWRSVYAFSLAARKPQCLFLFLLKIKCGSHSMMMNKAFQMEPRWDEHSLVPRVREQLLNLQLTHNTAKHWQMHCTVKHQMELMKTWQLQ